MATDEEKRKALLEAAARFERAAARLINNEPIEDQLAYCAFCGKTRSEVRSLIEGPSVYICDECVHRCKELLDQGGH